MKSLIILIISISFSSFLLAQSDKELAEESVSQNLIRSHIGFLASDELKGRDTPSEGLQIAARYIESRFVEYGVEFAPGMETYYQPVPMKKIKSIKEGTLKIQNTTLNAGRTFIYFQGASTIPNTEAVYVSFATEKDLKESDLVDKIAISLCGDGKSQSPQEWFSMSKDKEKRVKELGAIGLIELYNSPQIPWNVLTRYFGDDRVALDKVENDEEKEFFRAWVNRTSVEEKTLKSDDLNVSIKLNKEEDEKFTTYNLVGVVKGTHPKLSNEYVVYSAHYDHVGVGAPSAKQDSIFNGSRDNAVGTVTVLTAAQNIAKNPIKRSALFILFTGEEKGLLGSEYYVDNSPIELNDIVYCFNSDNGGYNDTTLTTIFGLYRTTVSDKIIEACSAFGLKAIDDPAPEQGLFDRSDNVNFAKKGIPAPTFSMGFTAFDETIYKYYHQVEDNPNTLDYNYLEKFFKSYVYTARLIGNMEEAPFWTEGDKYYDAGVNLYKRK